MIGHVACSFVTWCQLRSICGLAAQGMLLLPIAVVLSDVSAISICGYLLNQCVNCLPRVNNSTSFRTFGVLRFSLGSGLFGELGLALFN